MKYLFVNGDDFGARRVRRVLHDESIQRVSGRDAGQQRELAPG